MKVKTEQLKELVGKAIQGAGNNKLAPITQMMNISVKNKRIKIITTNSVDYLYITGPIEGKDELYVTVYAEQFAKLIGKITSAEIELVMDDKGNFTVKGNGEYTLELPTDENGEVVQFPDPMEIFKCNFESTIDANDIKTIVNSIKPSLATIEDDKPAILNYFVGKSVMATNRLRIAVYDTKLFNTDKELLMSSQLVDLLNIMGDTIEYHIAKNCMVFRSEGMLVYSNYIDELENYPIDVLEKLIEIPTESVCTVSKPQLIALLERIALFVGKYDDKAIRIYFEKNNMVISNNNRKSYETIDYITSKDFKEYDCSINVETFLNQLRAYPEDSVEIHYNSDNIIKLVSGDVTQIMALMV